MRPSLGATVAAWAWSSLSVFQETIVLDDFEKIVVKENERTLRCMVQPANPEDIQVSEIDWTLEHQLIHCRDDFAMNEFFMYKSKKYKIIQVDLWTDYGFTEGVAEEVRDRG